MENVGLKICNHGSARPVSTKKKNWLCSKIHGDPPGLARPQICEPGFQFCLLPTIFFSLNFSSIFIKCYEITLAFYLCSWSWLGTHFLDIFLLKHCSKATYLFTGKRNYESNIPNNISQQNVPLNTKNKSNPMFWVHKTCFLWLPVGWFCLPECVFFLPMLLFLCVYFGHTQKLFWQFFL